MKFIPETVIFLRRETPTSKYWRIKGSPWLILGIWDAWRSIYRAIKDKGRISEIKVIVTRKK